MGGGSGGVGERALFAMSAVANTKLASRRQKKHKETEEARGREEVGQV